MIRNILDEVFDAVESSFAKIAKEDYLSFILFIGRGDVIPGLNHIVGTDCVMDYKLDRYRDTTREDFYVRYLNRNYAKEGFRYQGVSGIDDLSIEMMIYCHLWDSTYFLKSLYRLACIIRGMGYQWNAKIPDKRKHDFIVNEIINPLKNSHSTLGVVLEKGYNSDIRNAFAHSLYNVNVESEEIYTWTRLGSRTYKFDEFQEIFLYSVILMNQLQNLLGMNHDKACSKNNALTDVFKTPEGIEVQVYGNQIERCGRSFPEFKMVKVCKE